MIYRLYYIYLMLSRSFSSIRQKKKKRSFWRSTQFELKRLDLVSAYFHQLFVQLDQQSHLSLCSAICPRERMKLFHDQINTWRDTDSPGGHSTPQTQTPGPSPPSQASTWAIAIIPRVEQGSPDRLFPAQPCPTARGDSNCPKHWQHSPCQTHAVI